MGVLLSIDMDKIGELELQVVVGKSIKTLGGNITGPCWLHKHKYFFFSYQSSTSSIERWETKAMKSPLWLTEKLSGGHMSLVLWRWHVGLMLLTKKNKIKRERREITCKCSLLQIHTWNWSRNAKHLRLHHKSCKHFILCLAMSLHNNSFDILL